MKVVILIFIIIGAIYYDFWEDINNKDNWKTLTLNNIRLKGDVWQRSDIRFPSGIDGHTDYIEYKVAIPHRYLLERERYIVDIEVSPTEATQQIAVQIVTTRQSDGQRLKVESSWHGNCGTTDLAENIGSWFTELREPKSIRHHYFTDPKAIGFTWDRGNLYCTEDTPKTIEHASSFPILLKIFDGSALIGEEQIDFEIFGNGIMTYPRGS